MARSLFVSLLFQFALICTCTNDFLSKTRMRGGSAFFRVKRDRLQARLDEINNGGNGVQFYLPAEPVMQGAIGSDEHVIMIDFGYEEAVSFSDVIGSHDTCTTQSKVANIKVPFISTTVNGAAELSLLLKTYRSENGEKHVISASPVVPTEIDHVDELVIRDDFLLLVDGDQMLVIEERTSAAECSSPHPEDVETITKVENTLVMSLTPPDFSICQERPDLDVDFCDFYRDHAEEIATAGNDVCEYLRLSADVRTCTTTFDIVNISDEMRNTLLLEADVTESVEGTYQHGTYAVYIKVPCFTQQLARRKIEERHRFFDFS